MNAPITELRQKTLGKRLPRHDAHLQVAGKIRYAEDMKFPGMLHAKFLRSPHAHAKVVRIDTSRAQAAPGVKAVITGADVPFNLMGAFKQDQPVLANEIVRFIGDPVAAVAATSVEAAEAALKLIEVDYAPLPAIFDPFKALEPDAPILHGDTNILGRWGLECGDVDAALAAAHLVVEETFTTQIVEQCPLETQIAIADPNSDGTVTVYTPHSRPFAMRVDVARALKVDISEVRVIGTPGGGAFGGKSDACVEPACAILALKTRLPVRVVFTREEEFFASTLRHPMTMTYRSGVDAQGRLVARDVKMHLDTGAYAGLGEATIRKATLLGAGPYKIPNVRIQSLLIYTNNPVSSAMRGFGVPQACFAWESHTETLAERMGMNSFDFRMLNGYEDGDITPSGQTIHSVGLKETMRKAREAFDRQAGGKK